MLEGIIALLLLSQELKKADAPPSREPVTKVEGKSSSTALTDKNAAGVLAKSSVRVSCSQFGGRVGYGSGTVVKKGVDTFHVLTCSHVAEPAVSGGILRVRHGDKSHPAKLLVYCPVRDIALLECKGSTEATPAVVAVQDDYKPGATLYRCGYPLGGVRKVVRCKVAPVMAWSGLDRKHRVLIASPTSISGDSGGGMFRASDGSLVAVNYAGGHYTEPGATITAARLEGIWKLLKYSGVPFDAEPLSLPKKEK